MSALGHIARQLVFTNKSFWRNPAAAFFTFAFPLMFLVIFTSLFGARPVILAGSNVHSSSYYVASMSTFSVVSACYTNLAINVAIQRDAGVLKRARGTPLPAWTYLTARVLHAVIIAALLVTICILFGRAFYDAHLPSGDTLVQFLLALTVGAGSFAALGLAIAAVLPNADASPAIVNATILPLLFVSGIFVPLGNDAPQWVTWIARIFPVKHFFDAMRASYLGLPFQWNDLWIVGAWGLGGLVVAVRLLNWDVQPRRRGVKNTLLPHT